MLNVSQLSRTDILKAAADFSTCDRDHDGFVSLEELTAFIKTTEQVPSSAPLTPIIVNNYERFDQNHDNRLDFEEFVEMITNDTFLKDFTNLGNRYVKFLVVPVCRTKRITKVQLQRMHTITGMYENEVKFKATDIGMIMLSLIQIILFYTSFKDQLVFKHDKRQQVWRYVTYMFTHNSQFHLFENVAIQLLVGLPLEMVHSWRVLIIYSAGILGGALFQSVIYPYEDLAGGSPGVYSILTAHIATVIMNWREMSQPVVQLIIFGTFSVFDTIYNYITIRNSDEISYISHLGGAVCGLLVGVNILRNLRETNAEKIIWWICIVLYFGIMSTFIGLELRLNLSKGAQPTRWYPLAVISENNGTMEEVADVHSAKTGHENQQDSTQPSAQLTAKEKNYFRSIFEKLAWIVWVLRCVGSKTVKIWQQQNETEMTKYTIAAFSISYVDYVVPKSKRHRFKPIGRSATATTQDGFTEPDGAYETGYTLWPPPLCMVLMSICEIICFVLNNHIKNDDSKQYQDAFQPVALALIYHPRRRHEAWRYFTYMFVHIGWAHLIMNLICQICLGLPLELRNRWWRVLTVYVAGVACGSLTTSIFDPHVFLAGASGGVYAIITAHLANIAINWSEMTFPAIQLFIMSLLIICDVAFAVHNRYLSGDQTPIGYAAHVGGALAGLLVGIWVLKNVEPTNREKYLWWAAFLIFLLLIGTAILLNVFWTAHFSSTTY
ncbi:hypothetical protein YQE_08414, partial [Dendroctonus ponderosae]